MPSSWSPRTPIPSESFGTWAPRSSPAYPAESLFPSGILYPSFTVLLQEVTSTWAPRFSLAGPSETLFPSESLYPSSLIVPFDNEGLTWAPRFLIGDSSPWIGSAPWVGAALWSGGVVVGEPDADLDTPSWAARSPIPDEGLTWAPRFSLLPDSGLYSETYGDIY